MRPDAGRRPLAPASYCQDAESVGAATRHWGRRDEAASAGLPMGRPPAGMRSGAGSKGAGRLLMPGN